MLRDKPLPKYIPELDGLRAIAILAVMLYHLNARSDWFSLGWMGVMLFFVLSGFLITGMLLDSKSRPGYLRNFYSRRAFRILPIYYLSLAVVTGWGAFEGRDLGGLGYYLTYSQNYLLGFTDFHPNFPNQLNHTWSLAIEEQFYLLWPLIVLWLSPKRLLAFLAGLFTLALASRALVLSDLHNASLLYAALPTQMDSLAAGAALAVLVRILPDPRALAGKALWVAVASGVALLYLIRSDGLVAFWHAEVWGSQLRNLPLFSLLALFFAGILAVAVLSDPDSILASLLRLKFLRHVGKISYGLYMYHFPAYYLVDKVIWNYLPHETSRLTQLTPPAAKLLLAYALALASWKFIESPVLRLRDRFP